MQQIDVPSTTPVADALLDEDSPLSRARTEVTVRFLLEIHNLAPSDSEIRSRVLDAIRQAAKRDPKTHWARGLMQVENGDLVFDEIRYELAVYRGKQDTYAAAAQKAFDELQSSLDKVSRFQAREQVMIGIEEAAIKIGTPLVDLTIPTRPAALLKASASSLSDFVQRMEGGMDVAVTGPASGLLIESSRNLRSPGEKWLGPVPWMVSFL